MKDEKIKSQPPISQTPILQPQGTGREAASPVTQFGMEVAAMPALSLAPARTAVEKTTIEKLLQKMKDL